MDIAPKDHIEWGKMYNQLAEREASEICASSRYGIINKKVIRKIEKDITGKLQLNPEDDLLDLGCGTGLISTDLSGRVRNITGLDLGNSVLQRTRRNFKASCRYIELVQGDVTNLPFRDESFTKILCYSVVMCFHDYDDFKQALSEMLRVCKPGGKILVGDIPDLKKKTEWTKGTRPKSESFFSYLLRRMGQDAVKFRYKMSARNFDKTHKRLDIYRPQAKGMFYESEKILAICRETGVKGTILDQPSDLAFGNTRVDLLLDK